MIRRTLKVDNKLGLHARAAAKVVEAASAFDSQVCFSHAGRDVDAKSIMGIMMLGATTGTQIDIVVSGTDEVEADLAIASLFENRFGEDE